MIEQANATSRPRVLVIAAHADDEALGCGGSLARHSALGHDTAVLLMTDGVGSREDAGSAEAIRRGTAMNLAMQAMGVQTCERFDFPDNAMDSVPLLEITRAIEKFVDGWGIPDRIYTHHPGDLNVDHQLTHRATMTCFRPQPGRHTVREILCFEVPSSTGWMGSGVGSAFVPNWSNNISDTLEQKKLALRAYDLEMRPWPHARSHEAVEALARHRGATVGVEAAEAFVVERIIVA
ncbi:PIG-L deacetylase family protein [Crateriforma spongiae]|uniref:PIG-L deacetylase family protein n=1 Tax=Crateriforma spongiae TaxID=2724528 RepID=UPI0039AFE83B